MAPHSSTLAWKIHGQRSLVGCSPWGTEESDTTEWLHFHFSLSCIGEGNGNPLQGSCLENPRDGGAWWAAVSGVSQSRTRLKWLSSRAEVISTKLWRFRIGYQFQPCCCCSVTKLCPTLCDCMDILTFWPELSDIYRLIISTENNNNYLRVISRTK